MWTKRCFKPDRSRPAGAIIRDLGHKVDNIEDIIKSLLNKRFLGRRKKKGQWRYWVNAGDTKRVLMEHGRI